MNRDDSDYCLTFITTTNSSCEREREKGGGGGGGGGDRERGINVGKRIIETICVYSFTHTRTSSGVPLLLQTFVPH